MGARLGQHFLVDKTVVDKIIQTVHPTKTDVVIEIGPGRGVLTEQLLSKTKTVVAIEIDAKLVNYLTKRLGKFDNLKVVNADVLQYDFFQILEKCGETKIVANLPYYISTPIIRKILSLPYWTTAVLMVQTEVGQRLCAHQGNKRYGILSIATQLYATAEHVFRVSSTSFNPSPKVESIVIKLYKLDKPLIPVEIEEKFFYIVKTAFNQRRKTILNSLSHGLDVPKKQIEQIIVKTGINPDFRAEDISIAQFLELLKVLQSHLMI